MEPGLRHPFADHRRALRLHLKGRIEGGEDFSVTRNEVLHGQNAERYRLALVTVSRDGAEHDQIRYVTDPFAGVDFGDFAAVAIRGVWADMWARGAAPH